MLMQRSASLAAFSATLAAAGIFSVYSQVLSASSIVGAFQGASALAHEFITRGFVVAPALMLGLVLIAAVPLIAIMSPIVFQATRAEASTRRHRPVALDSDGTGSAGMNRDRFCPPGRAFLEFSGMEGSRYAIVRDMLRIGREDDNDICIANAAVHRYHAAIYREHGDDWFIADLSGDAGKSVRVNGRPCSDARLKDGDVIEVGASRLRFRAVGI